MKSNLPSRVDEAVNVLFDKVPDKEQDAIAKMPEHKMLALHEGLGMWVRNNFGLWAGNEDLLADTGALDPDGASAVIVRTFWERLRRRCP